MKKRRRRFPIVADELSILMRPDRSTILFVFAVLGFAVLSMTPRGLALCIGGGHELDESIAGWCDEHGGHMHAPHEDEYDEHTDHHEHGDHSEPCADIPLGVEDCRPQMLKSVIPTPVHVLAAPSAQLVMMDVATMPVASVQSRARAWRAAHTGPPCAVRDALRAVILLI